MDLPIGKKSLSPYGGITVSDSGTASADPTSDSLVRKLSRTQTRLACPVISLVYAILLAPSRLLGSFSMVPDFMYGLVVKAFLVLATVLGNLLGIGLWEKEVW